MKLARTRTTPIATVGVVLALGVGLAACAGGDTGGDAPKEINLYVTSHPWSEALVAHIPEYEKETGVTVKVTQLEQQQLEDQASVRLNAGSTDIDVLMYRPLQVNTLYGQNGYLADLTDYIAKSPEWDWKDYVPAAQQLVEYNNQTLGVPVTSETMAIFYRKDLLQKAGLAVPTTIDELVEAAAAIKAQNPGTAGFISRTTAAGANTPFASFLFAYGGNWQEDGKSKIDTPEAVDAYQVYADLIRKYGPDNVSTDMEWTDADALFAAGKSGFLEETSSNYNTFADPSSSQVVDTFGVIPFPEGPAGDGRVFTAAYSLGISQFSTKKDQAWDFIKWATSPEMTATLTKENALGMRSSSLTEEALANLPQDLQQTIIQSMNGTPFNKPTGVVQVTKALEIVGSPVVEGIQGNSVRDAAVAASKQYQALLDEDADK